MPLKEFTDEAFAGLIAGKEEIPVGVAAHWYNAFEPQRQKAFHQVAEMMKKNP